MSIKPRERTILTDSRINSTQRGMGVSPMHFAPCSKIKHLQPIISRVHRPHSITFIHTPSPRIRKLPRLVSTGPPQAQTLPCIPLDELHSVVPKLAHDQVPILVLIE